jgi:hypothetical protein
METRSANAEVLTITQVFEHLRVTERDIYLLGAARKLPAFKLGEMRAISKSVINTSVLNQPEDAENAGRP